MPLRGCTFSAVFTIAVALSASLASPRAHAGDAAPSQPPKSTDQAADAQELTALRAIEAKLAAGASLTDEERALPPALATRGASPRGRALAAAVCAWLDPGVTTLALVAATGDADAVVRATALASLVSLARRFEERERTQALQAALLALDDKSDEVACAAVELVQVLAPAAAADAVRERAATPSNLRYACFARVGGLPVRPLDAPPLATDETAQQDSTTPPVPEAPVPAVAAHDGTWLLVVVGAAAGAVAGGALPAGFVPSRDVLTYRPDRTRLVHEEISFGAQLLGAAAGGALGGASLFGLAALVPPSIDDAGSAALTAGAGMLLGGSLSLMLGLKDSAAVWTFSGAAAGGLAVGAALAAFGELSGVDRVLSLSLAAGGMLAGGLAVFTALPVALDDVGGALRSNFGLGVAGVSAATLGLTGLALGLLVEVPAHRSVAALATGVAAAGLVGGVTFLLIPNNLEVKSGIACGSALAAQILGSVAGALFLPDSMFSDAPTPGTALHLDLSAPGVRMVRVGVPTLIPLVDLVDARGAGLAASLLSGSF